MKRYFVITGTITYAIKGRDVLRRSGFHAELTRTVHAGGNVGCGYGIITNCDPDRIQNIFFEYGIRYLQIKEHRT